MDKYTELVKAMAEAFMTAVRVLEEENARLKGENRLLTLELKELREKTDTYYER